MLERLYEYRKMFERELLEAEAQKKVIDKIIAAEEMRNAQNHSENEDYREVAEQPITDESY
jgi:hypothetical protein